MKDIFLLDVDETLLDFKRSEHDELLRALKEAGIEGGEEAFLCFDAVNDRLWKQLERGEITRERLLIERFEILIEELGYGACAQSISESYVRGMEGSAYLLDGAEDFLRTLGAMGRIYLVTNGSLAVQRGRLKISGIGKKADGIFISQEVGADKPSRRYTDFVAAHIPEFSPERAVWIGDSLTSDRLSAEAMGVDFILYRHDGFRPAEYGGYFAEGYSAVLSLLEKL